MKKNLIKKLILDNINENEIICSKIYTSNSNSISNVKTDKDFNYKYNNDNIYYKSEIALWKAVILQALVDLQSNSKKKIANTYRVKSLMWFNLKNKDFITVCNYAGLDPQYVYDKSRIIKKNNNFLN